MNFAGFSAYKILIPNYNRMRIRALAFAMLMAFSSAVAVYAMTDDQVINYVKQRSAAGISHQQIGKELIAKGVSPEQVERLKAQYEDSQGSDANVADKSVAQNNRDRVRDASNEISAAALSGVGKCRHAVSTDIPYLPIRNFHLNRMKISPLPKTTGSAQATKW